MDQVFHSKFSRFLWTSCGALLVAGCVLFPIGAARLASCDNTFASCAQQHGYPKGATGNHCYDDYNTCGRGPIAMLVVGLVLVAGAILLVGLRGCCCLEKVEQCLQQEPKVQEAASESSSDIEDEIIDYKIVEYGIIKPQRGVDVLVPGRNPVIKIQVE